MSAIGGAYDELHVAGVVILVAAGALSGLAILFILMAALIRYGLSLGNRLIPYFVSLLVANFLQALGSFMNLKWVVNRTVETGTYCSLQGGIKQAGNVGMALWSFVLSTHVFNIIFMRLKSSNKARYTIPICGWLYVLIVVALGPLIIQNKDKGPYFGPSGYWCWITDEYPLEQTFLEYFFEFLSSGLSFLLFIAILLRVRGNLIHTKAGWRLHFVPRSERWQLAVNRDWLDSSMMRIAARLLWYPIMYITLLLPISIARLYAFAGANVPFAATIFSDTLFNLQGFVNVILLIATHHLIPDPSVLPSVAPRKAIDLSAPEAKGITPFYLPPLEDNTTTTGEHTTASLGIEDDMKSIPLAPPELAHLDKRDSAGFSYSSRGSAYFLMSSTR